jgi:hypothetical protein
LLSNVTSKMLIVIFDLITEVNKLIFM